MVFYGTYASLADLKAALNNMAAANTDNDSALRDELEAVSRWIDGPEGCNRHFQPRIQTRYYTATRPDRLRIDDLLSVTTLKTLSANSGGTRTYGDVWAATDYDLEPYNDLPKTAIAVNPGGSHSFPLDKRGVELAGLIGYGDGDSATPYEASGSTVTVAAADGTTVTASDGTRFAPLQTILAGSEQMYITAVSGNNLTAVRGVNGTTAAAHAGAAASIFRYPAKIKKACLLRAAQLWMLRQGPMGQMAGGEFAVSTAATPYAVIMDLLSEFRRIEVA
jgi:hypothetical protein